MKASGAGVGVGVGTGVAVGVGVGIAAGVGLGVATGVDVGVALGLGAAEAAAEARAVVALALAADDGAGVTPIEPPQAATTSPVATSPANVRRMDIGRALVRPSGASNLANVAGLRASSIRARIKGFAEGPDPASGGSTGSPHGRVRAQRPRRLRQYQEAAAGERPKDVEVPPIERDDRLRLKARGKDNV